MQAPRAEADRDRRTAILEDAGQDGRGDVDHAGARVLHDQPLHPLQDHVALRARRLEILEARGVEAVQVQMREVGAIEARDLAEGEAHQEAHQPGEEVLELVHLLLHLWARVAKGDEVAAAVQPDTATLLDERQALAASERVSPTGWSDQDDGLVNATEGGVVKRRA